MSTLFLCHDPLLYGVKPDEGGRKGFNHVIYGLSGDPFPIQVNRPVAAPLESQNRHNICLA